MRREAARARRRADRRRRALGERLLEDRRIRRHPRERVVPDAAREIAVAEHRAVDEVEPDGLAGVVQPLEAILRHLSQETGKQASQRNISRYTVNA